MSMSKWIANCKKKHGVTTQEKNLQNLQNTKTLWELNSGLVSLVCSMYRKVDIDEAWSLSWIAIIKAQRTYCEGKSKFSSWYRLYLQTEFQNYINYTEIVHVPVKRKKEFKYTFELFEDDPHFEE